MSERPGGPFIDMARDAGIKFPKPFKGTLPPIATRDLLHEQMKAGFEQRKLDETQIKKALDFLEQYEKRYYEDMTTGQCYHRPCDGHAVMQGETGIFCERCGRLLDLIPPP